MQLLPNLLRRILRPRLTKQMLPMQLSTESTAADTAPAPNKVGATDATITESTAADTAPAPNKVGATDATIYRSYCGGYCART